MSADNGYVLRKNSAGKFVLQEYSASADCFPPIEDAKNVFDTLEDAIYEYEELESNWQKHGIPIEYGLTIHIRRD